jgi:regulator of sigma D
MLEGCKNAQERWSGVHELVDKWLQERQTLLVMYTDLVQQVTQGTLPENRQVQQLCEIMVDYTSAGHFEIFEQLYREAEAFSDQKAIELGNRVIPMIQTSTDVILDFNEAYDNKPLSSEQLDALSQNLSGLGEHLADRFQHEDLLIETLHTAHQELINT